VVLPVAGVPLIMISRTVPVSGSPSIAVNSFSKSARYRASNAASASARLVSPDAPAVHGERVVADLEGVGAADAGLAHAAGHHGRVGGLAAAGGQDALRGDHAGQDDRAGRRSQVEDHGVDCRAGGAASGRSWGQSAGRAAHR
jgi:hypothetical protein